MPLTVPGGKWGNIQIDVVCCVALVEWTQLRFPQGFREAAGSLNHNLHNFHLY